MTAKSISDRVLRDARFLVDTNVISHVIRPKRQIAHGILQFFQTVDEERLFLSVVTIAEIQKGIDLLANPADGGDLNRRLDALCTRFRDRIVGVDVEVARQFAHFQAWMRQAGLTGPLLDTLIASSAHVRDLTVASIDQDFLRFSDHVAIYNPVTHAFKGPQTGA